jgi:hypothetical protein
MPRFGGGWGRGTMLTSSLYRRSQTALPGRRPLGLRPYRIAGQEPYVVTVAATGLLAIDGLTNSAGQT